MEALEGVASRVLESQRVISDADFQVTDSQNRFKQSSTALLALTFIVFFAYSIIKFIIHRKTNYGLDKTAEVNEILTVIVKVIEHDLAPSLIVYYMIMGLAEFYVFAAIFGYFVFLIGGLLVLAYKMKNMQMIKIFRALLVLCTFCGFLNIFIDNMVFKGVDSNRLASLAAPSSG